MHNVKLLCNCGGGKAPLIQWNIDEDEMRKYEDDQQHIKVLDFFQFESSSHVRIPEYRKNLLMASGILFEELDPITVNPG